jgi:hypothetical protein
MTSTIQPCSLRASQLALVPVGLEQAPGFARPRPLPVGGHEAHWPEGPDPTKAAHPSSRPGDRSIGLPVRREQAPSGTRDRTAHGSRTRGPRTVEDQARRRQAIPCRAVWHSTLAPIGRRQASNVRAPEPLAHAGHEGRQSRGPDQRKAFVASRSDTRSCSPLVEASSNRWFAEPLGSGDHEGRPSRGSDGPGTRPCSPLVEASPDRWFAGPPARGGHEGRPSRGPDRPGTRPCSPLIEASLDRWFAGQLGPGGHEDRPSRGPDRRRQAIAFQTRQTAVTRPWRRQASTAGGQGRPIGATTRAAFHGSRVVAWHATLLPLG